VEQSVTPFFAKVIIVVCRQPYGLIRLSVRLWLVNCDL